MELKKTLIIAIVFSMICLAGWEIYWRSRAKVPDINDDKELWAVQRAKLKNLTGDDFVLIGSSRVLFDIQLDEWEKETGKRPVQLACAGSSPLPVFRDIVDNTDFIGTLIVGVTPGLFFSTTYPEARPWKRAQSRVEYFSKRTYAQRMNHFLGMPLEKGFAFVSISEEQWSDDIDLRSLVRNIRIGNRTGTPEAPPFYNFSETAIDRNVRMSDRTAIDTAFANTVKRVWRFFGQNAPPPDKDATMAFFLEDVRKFKERGGELILLRCPSSGELKAIEEKLFPRKLYWDELIQQADVKCYYYEDYDQLKHFECPEWSHLSAQDADTFTRELARIMIQDGTFPKYQTN